MRSRIAVTQWERDGVPANPRAWLISTGRNRTVDRIRRDDRFVRFANTLALPSEPVVMPDEPRDEEDGVDDDRLRLIFTCCHPALARESQVALTLRTICGLTTDEIARAFLVPRSDDGAASRAGDGKDSRRARIPYRVPPADELAERLDAVLAVVYLVFTEGYAATSGDALVRRDLSSEAIRLGRLLVDADARRNRGRTRCSR